MVLPRKHTKQIKQNGNTIKKIVSKPLLCTAKQTYWNLALLQVGFSFTLYTFCILLSLFYTRMCWVTMNELTLTSRNVYSRLNRLWHIVFVSMCVCVCFDIYILFIYFPYILKKPINSHLVLLSYDCLCFIHNFAVLEPCVHTSVACLSANLQLNDLYCTD